MVNSLIRAILTLFILYSGLTLARPVPELTSPVLDEANLLKQEDRLKLEQVLQNLQSSGGSQIAVVTIPSLEGDDINEFAIKVAEKWKLGSAKADNGLLLLIAFEDRKIRIEVGQGLEGLITDLHSKRVIDQVIAPQFRAGSTSQGIVDGVRAIIHYTDPTSTVFDSANFSPGSRPRNPASKKSFSMLGILFLLFFVAWLRSSMVGNGIYPSRRGWGGYHGGSSRGGGYSGGGFSGGGGGFSGGGASGGW